MKRSWGEHGFVLGALVLSCAAGFGLVFVIYWYGLRSAEPPYQARITPHQAGTKPLVVSRHSYLSNRGWNGCGQGFPAGQEGCSSQTGTAWFCDDGAKALVVDDHCTSWRAAGDEVAKYVRKETTTLRGWKIARIRNSHGATLIELARPITQHGWSGRWICIWPTESKVRMIYASDQEHLLDIHRKLIVDTPLSTPPETAAK